MPQMAPMWWTTISLISLMLMLLTMMTIYFNYMNSNKFNTTFKNKSMNWKWL